MSPVCACGDHTICNCGEYTWPSDCLCSHGYWMHDIEHKAKECSLLSCGCARYRPGAAA